MNKLGKLCKLTQNDYGFCGSGFSKNTIVKPTHIERTNMNVEASDGTSRWVPEDIVQQLDPTERLKAGKLYKNSTWEPAIL
jgi:hypothetical protein